MKVEGNELKSVWTNVVPNDASLYTVASVREPWLEPQRALETFGGSLVPSHMAEDDADGIECPGHAWPERQRPFGGRHGLVPAMQRRQPACELCLRFGV